MVLMRCYVDLSQGELSYLIRELKALNQYNDYDNEIISLQSKITYSKQFKMDVWNCTFDYQILNSIYKTLYNKLKLEDELLLKIEKSLKEIYGKKNI